MDLTRRTKAVFSHERSPGGYKEEVFIMFHGTSAQGADGILRNGFNLSDHNGNMLGAGVYASLEFGKAANYGHVVLKLLVYTGRVCKIDRMGHPLQKSWQGSYDSAWVPPGVNPSGREVKKLPPHA